MSTITKRKEEEIANSLIGSPLNPKEWKGDPLMTDTEGTDTIPEWKGDPLMTEKESSVPTPSWVTNQPTEQKYAPVTSGQLIGSNKYANQQQLNDIINSILNREKFSYDLNGDILYNQYKDRYSQQAKLAMEDAIGQASAMTGGYGNSYAQSVGQQMYQREMQGLNDIIPDLYQLALDKYNAEGQELLNKYNLLSDDYNRQFTNYWTQKQYDEAINSNSENSTSDWLTEDTEDTDNSQEESKTPKFEGTTQKDAIDYLQENGVPLADAAEAVMTEGAWKSRRNNYLKTGKDITGAGQFSSYEEYLSNITEYLISQYS